MEQIVSHLVGERVTQQPDEELLVNGGRDIISGKPEVPVAQVLEDPVPPGECPDAVPKRPDDERNDFTRVVGVCVELQPLKVLHGENIPLPSEDIVQALNAG